MLSIWVRVRAGVRVGVTFVRTMVSKFSYVCNIILRFSIFTALFIRWVLIGWQLQRKNFDTMMLWFDVKPLTEPEQHSPEFVFVSACLLRCLVRYYTFRHE